MASQEVLDCPHCSSSMSKMILPRRLPCGHIFCEKCLVGQFGTYGEIACHTCGEVLDSDVQPNSLPLDYGPSYSCGACLKKGVSVRASRYCADCDSRMCDKHTEVSSFLVHCVHFHSEIMIVKFIFLLHVFNAWVGF